MRSINRYSKFILSLSLLMILNITSNAQCFLDRHNTSKEASWTSCTASENPNSDRENGHWVMIELPQSYPIDHIDFWNHNHPDELDYGLQEIAIDLSLDGLNWSEQGKFVLPQATASSFYEGVEGPNLKSYPAKFILITALSNYGGSCYSLSEIRITSSGENPIFCEAEITEEIVCHDDNNAEITVHAIGGVPPYSFSIDGINFKQDSVFSDLEAGSYEVYVQDSQNLKSAIEEVIITQPDPIVTSSIVNDTSLFISATGGTGQLSFSLDGQNYQANNQFSIFENGSFFYYVKDEADCTTASSFFSFIDIDGDGFNSDEDCNDTNADINPDTEEIPNNDIDENCDGIILIIDDDGDGFNSDEDCDDANADINPDAEEIPNNDIDENCDGIILVIDVDGDGYNSDEDCDDDDPNINPGAFEIPNNGIDENCDGIDDIIDNDGDGFNSDEDCNDSDENINPDAEEIPNNDIDENCDGIILVIDVDGDGFNSDEDCDDNDPNIHPDAEEIPDNDIDENCDGIIEITSDVTESPSSLKIYPNPFNEFVVLELDKQEKVIVTILDATGKKISQLPLSSLHNKIELNNLVEGVYFLQIHRTDQQTPEVYELIKVAR